MTTWQATRICISDSANTDVLARAACTADVLARAARTADVPRLATRRSSEYRRRMAEVTFRDFAASVMKGDVEGGGRVLEQLLALDSETALGASQHFHHQSTAQGPAFMGKAMGLRAAVASGSVDAIAATLRDCFALTDASLSTAVAALTRTTT